MGSDYWNHAGRLTPKETICQGQMLLNGNAAGGLLTHHHCASATVPRPCKGTDISRPGRACLGLALTASGPYRRRTMCVLSVLRESGPTNRTGAPDSNGVGVRRRQTRPGRPEGNTFKARCPASGLQNDKRPTTNDEPEKSRHPKVTAVLFKSWSGRQENHGLP